MPKRDLHEAADDATQVTPYDRLMSGGMDLVEVVPVFGQVVSALLRQVVPQDHLIYLGEYLHEVADRIEAIEGREEGQVDRLYFETDAWRGDVERSVEALGDRRNREKRRHYVAALANAARVDRPVDAIRLRYFDILEQCRLSHLELLAVVATAEVAGPAGGAIDEYLTTRLADQDLENIKLDWGDLERAGVLAGGPPSGMASTPIHQRVAHSLNAFGQRFAAFVEAEPGDA